VAALSAVPAAAGVFFWLQNVALGAALGVVVGGGVLIAEKLSTPAEVAPTHSARADRWLRPRSPSSGAEHTPIVPSAARQEPAAPVAEVSVPVPNGRRTLPNAARGALVGEPQHSDPAVPSITREARLLEQARARLAIDPAWSLRVLEEHAREFGASALRIERDFLLAEALLRLGRVEEAKERAKQLHAAQPGHLYEQRLKSLFAERF